MKTKLSIIIPFLNEAENIPFLVNSLSDYFSDKKVYEVEIIFVNDGSSDNSNEILINQKHVFNSKIISLSRNYGSHAALRAGILNANGNYLMFMYADLQDPLFLIDQLFNKAIEGYDIVWATRASLTTGKIELWFSRLYSKLMKKYAISTFPENGFDIVLFSQKVAKCINQNIEANSSIFIQILTLGFKQFSINYNKQIRKIGKSKWTLKKKVKLLIDSFVAFSYTPIRFVTIMGCIFFIVGILWTFYIILRKILVGDLLGGWPTLMSVLLLGFGITNISLGIIAEYLWRTLDSTRNRPVFIIDEIIDLN
jgi:polyisoprenyl-phosphate glycosyltransferase